MNPTRWAFLYHGIQRAEVQQMEIMQATLSRALGLNLMPFKDEKTGKIRLPETFSEVAPLAQLIAPNDRLVEIQAQWDALRKQEQKPGTELPNPEDDWAVDPDLSTQGLEHVGLETDTEMEILDLSSREAATEILREPRPEVVEEDEPPRKPRGSFVLDD